MIFLIVVSSSSFLSQYFPFFCSCSCNQSLHQDVVTILPMLVSKPPFCYPLLTSPKNNCCVSDVSRSLLFLFHCLNFSLPPDFCCVSFNLLFCVLLILFFLAAFFCLEVIFLDSSNLRFFSVSFFIIFVVSIIFSCSFVICFSILSFLCSSSIFSYLYIL